MKKISVALAVATTLVALLFLAVQTHSVSLDGLAPQMDFDFNFDGEAFKLQDGESRLFRREPGTYTASETVPAGWELTDISCEGGSVISDTPSVTIPLNWSQNVACTFKNRPTSSIVITKEVRGSVEVTPTFKLTFARQSEFDQYRFYLPIVMQQSRIEDLSYLTVWSGDLRIFALEPNTKVTIYDLDTGLPLDLETDPRIGWTRIESGKDTAPNPFVLKNAGDSFEGFGGSGTVDREIRVRIVARDASIRGENVPILIWTGCLEAKLRHPDETPTNPENAWMSYIPAIPDVAAGPAPSRELGKEFLGFTSREMYILAKKVEGVTTTIVITDLVTNLDLDSDDSQTLRREHADYFDDEIEIYFLDQFEDDTVRITSNVDVSVLVGIGSGNPGEIDSDKPRRDWTATPPSYAPGDGGMEMGTLFYTYVTAYLTVFPLEDDTTVTITNLSEDDDTQTVTLANGDVNGEYDLYTADDHSGESGEKMVLREASPLVNVKTNDHKPFVDDYVKVASDKPVLVYVGPVASDMQEFADMAFEAKTEDGGRIMYAYAQNYGSDRQGYSHDLQIFALDVSTVVTITSLSYSPGVRNEGVFHDVVIGPGIGACPDDPGSAAQFTSQQPWCEGTDDGPVWWGSGVWAGEMLRIESTGDIVVINGDFDKCNFGTFIPFVVPRTPGSIAIRKEVMALDVETEEFSLTHGESKTFTPLAPGTYTVSETLPPGWRLEEISCVGASVTTDADSATIDLAPGERAGCTFINARETVTPNSIKIIKEVAGGQDTDTAFGFSVDGGAFPDEFSLKHTGEQLYDPLGNGTYTVTEMVPPGWLTPTINCDATSGDPGFPQVTIDPPQVTIGVGGLDDVVCTFTNELLPPKITIVKQVSGTVDATTPFTFSLDGDPLSEAFSLKHDGSQTYSALDGLTAGTYTVVETVPAGWELTDISCDGGSVTIDAPLVTIDLGPDDDVVCTFTNEAVGSIEIIKEATGPCSSSTYFDFTFEGQAFSLMNSESFLFEDLAPGVYSVTEKVPSGWVLKEISCVGGSVNIAIPQASIELGAGDNVVCTFKNERP